MSHARAFVVLIAGMAVFASLPLYLGDYFVGVALSLLARGLWAALRYRLRLRRTLADWQAGAETARSPEAWARLFEAPR